MSPPSLSGAGVLQLWVIFLSLKNSYKSWCHPDKCFIACPSGTNVFFCQRPGRGVKKQLPGSLSLLRPAQLTACSFYHENNFFAKCFLQVLPRSFKLTLIRILFYGGGSWPKSNVTPFLSKTKWCQKIHRFGPKPPQLWWIVFFLSLSGKIFSYPPKLGRESDPLSLTPLKPGGFQWHHVIFSPLCPSASGLCLNSCLWAIFC